jgi:MFS family permease
MNKSLKVLFLFNGIFVFSNNLLGPLYALFVGGIDNRVIAVSTSWAVFLASGTFFTFLMSKWGDKVKEKEFFLIGGYLLRGFVWFSYIFTDTFYMLLALQILLGLGESLGTPAYNAIFAEHLDKNKHIKEYSTWRVISTLSRAVAVFLGGILVSYFGFDLLFFLMGSLAMVSLFGILLSPRKLL